MASYRSRPAYKGLAAQVQWVIGRCHGELGAPVLAEAATAEAVALYRAAGPENIADLLRALQQHAGQLSVLGRGADALAALREAVDVHGRAERARLWPAHVVTLSALAGTLHDLDRGAESITLLQEAVGIARLLVAADPEKHRAVLAQCLHQLAQQQRLAGDPRAALGPSTEALARFRQLAAADPPTHDHDLGLTLINHASTLRKLAGDRHEALAALDQAVAIFATPGADEVNLARALFLRAVHLQDLDRDHQAVQAASQALELHQNRPDLPALLVGQCLSLIAECQAKLGQIDIAADTLHRLLALTADADDATAAQLRRWHTQRFNDVRALAPQEFDRAWQKPRPTS